MQSGSAEDLTATRQKTAPLLGYPMRTKFDGHTPINLCFLNVALGCLIAQRPFHDLRSSRSHPPLRAEEAAPYTELWNPADFVDEFTFFTCVLPLIPHLAIFCFPMGVGSRRKRRAQKCFCVRNACGHRYHLPAQGVSRLIGNLRPALLLSSLHSRFHSKGAAASPSRQ
jgi:hypothetical protein